MNKIIIEISGGVCSSVTTNVPVEVMFVDWDDIKEGGKPHEWNLTPVEGDLERRLQEIRDELKGTE